MIYSTNKNNCNRHTRIDTYKNKLLFFFFLTSNTTANGYGFLRCSTVKKKGRKCGKISVGWRNPSRLKPCLGAVKHTTKGGEISR